MNYGEIKKFDIANGPGIRVSLFVSGCSHHCKGCFNEGAWDFNFGKTFTRDTEEEIMQALAPNHIKGLTILGGEPFEKSNQEVLLPFLRRVRDTYPILSIWCYTGYTLEVDLLKGSRVRTEHTKEMLGFIDVLVDGKFILEQRNISLAFRGSSNQRIIDMKHWRNTGEIVVLDL